MSRSSPWHAEASTALAAAVAGRSRSAWLTRGVVRWAQRGWHAAARAARLAIGIPDYDAYVAHMRERHPGGQPMDRGAFFRERMQARYGKGRTRCC
jgi:uncharacterized short protein YbdD (DUF466 family)